MKHPTNNEILYAEQRDLAIEERDAAIARAKVAEVEVAALKARIDEMQAAIVARNKTIAEREAEVVECQENYYELETQAHEFESEAAHNGEIMQSLAAEVAAPRTRVAELEAQPRIEWRPVSEPPPRDGDYLVFRRPDLKYQSNARPDAVMMVAWFQAGRTRHTGELCEWFNNPIILPITHWRPLPEPPTGEGTQGE